MNQKQLEEMATRLRNEKQAKEAERNKTEAERRAKEDIDRKEGEEAGEAWALTATVDELDLIKSHLKCPITPPEHWPCNNLLKNKPYSFAIGFFRAAMATWDAAEKLV